LPEPEPGLVFSYAYLWRHEALQGRQEGRKDRPSVIIAAVERKAGGPAVVTVVPITHRAPNNAATAVEMPQVVKERLGLDLERSWVMIDEANQFAWPGYDLRKVPGREGYDYGFLPPRFFEAVMSTARAWLKRHGVIVTPR